MSAHRKKKGCLSCLKNIFTRNNNRLEQAVEEMGLINNNNETETLPGRPFENISTLEPINISDPIRLLAKSNINYYDKLFTIEQFSTMEYQLLRNALYNKDPFSSSGMQRIGFLTEERLVNFLANNMDAVIPEDKSGILLAPHQVVILEVLVNSNLPPQGRTLDEAFVN